MKHHGVCIFSLSMTVIADAKRNTFREEKGDKRQRKVRGFN